jgi:hypothetical protein
MSVKKIEKGLSQHFFLEVDQIKDNNKKNQELSAECKSALVIKSSLKVLELNNWKA